MFINRNIYKKKIKKSKMIWLLFKIKIDYITDAILPIQRAVLKLFLLTMPEFNRQLSTI